VNCPFNSYESNHPDAVFLIAGDFNHANLESVLQKYYQHAPRPVRMLLITATPQLTARQIICPCFLFKEEEVWMQE